jgi:hypothetical protein
MSSHDSQALSGITSQQALNMSFSVALMTALTSELGYPINVDSIAQIGKRRILLANINIAYRISTNSLQATDGWISTIQSSVASPNFMTSMRNITGYPDITVLKSDVVNISPTGRPSTSPISAAAGKITAIRMVLILVSALRTINNVNLSLHSGHCDLDPSSGRSSHRRPRHRCLNLCDLLLLL